MANELTVYFRGASFHVRDLDGHHWTIRQGRGRPEYGEERVDPAAVYMERQGALYVHDEQRVRRGRGGMMGRRFAARRAGWQWPSSRGFRHGLMNAVTQEGSWAWYTGWGGYKRPASQALGHGYVPARAHTAAMNAATTTELGVALTATQYARRGHGAWWTGGHSTLAYEWCHLVGHGMGGADTPANIVAATAHQNSEQLILECVLYGYRMEGLDVEVEAKLARGTAHLGESIWYKVFSGATRIYQRTMDCRRATKPNFTEFTAVAREVRRAINAGLAVTYPADHLNYDQQEYIDEHLDEAEHEADGAAGFWAHLAG